MECRSTSWDGRTGCGTVATAPARPDHLGGDMLDAGRRDHQHRLVVDLVVELLTAG